MNSKIEVDSEGKIELHLSIRKKLNIKPSEKFDLKIENGSIILNKSSTYAEFIDEIKKFLTILTQITDKPISTEKLF